MDLIETVAEPGVHRFLGRFFAWGAAPTVDGYTDLFDPEGGLLDAGMDEPLRGGAIRTSMTRTPALIPGFRFEPRWRLAFDSLSLPGAADAAALRDHLQVRAPGPVTEPAGGGSGS